MILCIAMIHMPARYIAQLGIRLQAGEGCALDQLRRMKASTALQLLTPLHIRL